MDKNDGVYLMLQIDEKPTEDGSLTKETEIENKIRRNTNFCFHLIKKTKKISRVVKQEIHFHGYERRTKSFEEEKNTIFLIIKITKTCPAF